MTASDYNIDNGTMIVKHCILLLFIKSVFVICCNSQGFLSMGYEVD